MQFYLGLVILSFMEGALIFKRSFLRQYAKTIFFLAIAAVTLLNIYYSRNLYVVWGQSPIMRAMLPPTTPINYFLFYVFIWAFAPYLLSLAAALILMWALKLSNRKSGGKYCETEEPWIAATAIFLCGWPGWLVYLIILIVTYLLAHLLFSVSRRLRRCEWIDDRLPLYHLWIPIAACSILISKLWLPGALPFWSKLLL
jgi:hypothetical protein